MKRSFSLVLSILVISSMSLFAQGIPPDSLYLGQTPPGNVRKVFNLISDQGYFACEKIAISPDVKEIYYEETKTFKVSTSDESFYINRKITQFISMEYAQSTQTNINQDELIKVMCSFRSGL